MLVGWNGEKITRAVHTELRRRLNAAGSFLEGSIKQDISQPGALSYRRVTKKGRVMKTVKKIYNYTHSRPGNPPFKQYGKLRQSITHEVVGMTCRVGTNLKYGRYLEFGTRRMKSRPFLGPNLRKNRKILQAMLSRPMTPGELPKLGGEPSRRGIAGVGSFKVGF